MAAEPATTAVRPIAAPAVTVTPTYHRTVVQTGETKTVRLDLVAPPGTSVLAVDAGCPCVRAATPLPAKTPASGHLDLELTVTGAIPGVKTIAISTSDGPVTAHLDVATPGYQSGKAALDAAIASAQRNGATLWIIAHDLHGAVRGCGCSDGSLGGIDHLAALPALAPAARFILTGNVDGDRQGVGAALVAAGWTAGDPALLVTGDPAAHLADPGIVGIISSAPAPNHARIVRPILDRGQILLALEVVAGRIVDRHAVPVDATLPAQAAILAQFPTPIVNVDLQANPSTACASCHQAAFQAWQGSRHARAFASLKAADRTSDCVGCHLTGVAQVPVANVHCQACHQGTDGHAANPQVKTAGTVDCRGCHDARHHPGFDRKAGWKAIQH